jgi:RNA polymerase sigma-70 factor (ECF subfamily)
MVERGGLAEAVAAARARWPEITFGEEEFTRYLDHRQISDETIAARGVDLFLAAACAAGDPAALRALDVEHLEQVGGHVRARMKASDALIDEVRQALRIKLLLDKSPRIARYDGSGPLGAFVRVAAVRVALDLVKMSARAPQAMDPERVARRLSAPQVGESQLARLAHGPRFQAALEEALVALPERDRAVLRFHFVEGLNIEAIGKVYRVHRATVARWLVDIRGRLFQAVEKRLAVDLRITPSEFRSLLGTVQDDLRISISRVLDGGQR